MPKKVVIAPTTLEVTSDMINLSEAMGSYVNFQTTGLASGEEIAFQVTAMDSATPTDWEAAVQGGGAVVLSVDQNSQAVRTPACIRLHKPATAAAVGVMMIDRYSVTN